MEKLTEQILLSEIKQEWSLWPRAGYDETALARYRESLDRLPPIRVDRKSRILLDGFHRVRVYQDAKREEIPVIFEDSPPDEYLLRALELNLHGAPIPTEQRNALVVRLFKEGFKQDQIAKACGISQERVSQILASYNRDRSGERNLAEAIRLIDAGDSFREAEKKTGVPRSSLERAVREAKQRQELIRKHLQTRSGVTSLLRYPDRGPWGKSSYFGNCTGYLPVDLIDYFKPDSVFDPMEGSGTTREVCADLKVDYEGRDLKTGFDLLSSPLPDRKFDLVFWHPPYWPGFRYSDHPNDFSNSEGPVDYTERMREGFTRLREILTPHGHLVILIGDGRKNGVFYPIHADIIGWDLLPLEAILIKEGDHERRARHFKYGPTLFIPTLHEYVVVFKKEGKE
jgi:predicted DNA-binding protein (UPF0251 family)